MSTLLIERQGAVETWTMNDPATRNALSDAVVDSLLQACERAAQDPTLRVVVLTGAGGAFCAGGSLGGFSSLIGKALQDGETDPLLTMNVYEGDLGLDSGIPSNAFSLQVHGLKQLTGGKTGVKGIQLKPGESANLPNGLGSVSFDSLRRYASLDVDYNPGQGWVLFFALFSLAGLIMSLVIPRRRVWVKLTEDGFQVAALARGDDPLLAKVVADVSSQLTPSKKSAPKNAEQGKDTE